MRVLRVYPLFGGSRMVLVQDKMGQQRNISCFIDKGHVTSAVETLDHSVSFIPKGRIPQEVVAALEV